MQHAHAGALGALAICLTAALAGCAAPQLPATLASASRLTTGSEVCSSWFDRLDAVTRAAGVADGSAHRLPGVPFLRSNRFLASFGDEVASDTVAFNTWIGHLAALDREARAAELQNLPQQSVLALNVPTKPAVAAQTAACAAAARQAWQSTSVQERRTLANLAQVPDDYSTTQRVLGAYAATRIPFYAGVARWQQGTAEAFARSSPPAGTTLRLRPAGNDISPARAAASYARRNPDALGIPQPTAQEAAVLLRAYAPEWHIDTRGPYDRIGALHWSRDSAQESGVGLAHAPMVDTAQPVTYARLAFTRYQGQTLLQLIYSVWFPERPLMAAVDLLGGKLDSVVLRITLAPNGTPWVMDSIHSCGCYHLFFPTPQAALRAPPADMAPPVEWAFVPTTLPALGAGQRVSVRLASQTHYVEAIEPLAATGNASIETTTMTQYELIDDNALRNLPIEGQASDTTRSAFWPSGIVPGTERGERILFWPMGIESPGAMRQWGRQPTAFVGRRHFDDARLMEQRFELKAP